MGSRVASGVGFEGKGRVTRVVPRGLCLGPRVWSCGYVIFLLGGGVVVNIFAVVNLVHNGVVNVDLNKSLSLLAVLLLMFFF